MPTDAEAIDFIRPSKRAVMTTRRKDGGFQTSVVTAVPRPDGKVFVWTRANTAKYHNLKRDPRCALCAVDDQWHSWVAIEATVEVVEHADAYTLLEDYYRYREGKEHDNWAEWHRRADEEGRHMFILTPTRVVPQIR
ncbi:MAG TPA: TIGR03618 family F420-dependent PPOX class oxidoreductase [Chloroflexota bacterium]|nr:TIGR03618 family F420-dependent PPOX class oxidoreductase [Chloroflexota bacterium]